MARRRGQGPPQPPETAPHHVAAQQDQSEVANELGAEKDPDNGELAVEERAARKAGAVDTESVVENRRIRRIVHGKRTGQRDIHVNIDDILVKYDTILRLYPADSMYISVKRLSGGAAVQQIIQSAPRDGRKLYEALLVVHGRHEEATYQVNFYDASSKEYRGKGQITLPDTRDPAAQGQPAMNYPPPYGGYPPMAAAPPGYPQPFPPQPSQPAPQAASPDVGALLTGFRQLMDMMQAYQSGGGPFPAPSAFSGAPQGAPSQVPGDLTDQFNQLRQMLDLLQSGGRPGPRGAPQVPMMNPQMVAALMGMGMPPVQPPPGTMWVPGFGFVALDRLMQALGAAGPGGGGGYRGPYRAPYAPGGGGVGENGEPPHVRSPYPPIHAPAPEKTAVEQFRDSLTLMRTVQAAARDFSTLFASGQEPPDNNGAPPEDDSPVRVIDTGPAKIVINKRDGSLRAWETGWANIDKVLKWTSDQIEIARARQAQQPPRPVLPEGFVEVGPGYQPPPGFVAVPVGRPMPAPVPRRAPVQFPAPPAHMPPPLGGEPFPQSVAQPVRPVAAAPPRPAAKRTWAAPTLPGQG